MLRIQLFNCTLCNTRLFDILVTITFVHYINTRQHNTSLLDILVVELLRLYTTSILVHTKMLQIQLSGICSTNSCPCEYAQDTNFQLYTMQYSPTWYPGSWTITFVHHINTCRRKNALNTTFSDLHNKFLSAWICSGYNFSTVHNAILAYLTSW